MIRAVTITDPLWTDQDTAEMLALAEFRAALCPCGCGHLADDTMSMEGVGPDFQATRVVCRARLSIIETERAVDSGGRSPAAAARLWSTTMKAVNP